MSKEHIIRALRDPEYRDGLSDSMKAMLPENPAGLIELTDADLDSAVGAENKTCGNGGNCAYISHTGDPNVVCSPC
jgi:mersacidin/lichenicidin family type 2 lantibiotic